MGEEITVTAGSAEAVPADVLQRRRELAFLVLAGLFLGTMGMLNILGLTRFLQLGRIGSLPVAVAVGASMVACMAAQFTDVRLFHFWKRVSGGRALWLRNNGSTLVSQLVDTSAVVLISHDAAPVLPVKPELPVLPQLASFIASGDLFKLIAALAGGARGGH